MSISAAALEFGKLLFSLMFIRKEIAIVLAFYLLKRVSNHVSQGRLNNWLDSPTWNSTKELVVLTGGSSGIGKHIMLDLAKLGTKVAIVDIQEPDFTLPPNVFYYEANIISSAAVKDVADRIRQDHGHPTVLINNAGVAYYEPVLDQSEESIRQTLEVNALSPFWTVKEFLPEMIRNDHGHIVTMASVASFLTPGSMTAYSCSKAGVLAFHEGLTQEIRHWHGSKRVRTSVVHPMFVWTPLTDPLVRNGLIPGQSMLKPEEVSSVVVKHLISGNSGQLAIPSSYGLASLLKGLPSWFQEHARDMISKKLAVNKKGI